MTNPNADLIAETQAILLRSIGERAEMDKGPTYLKSLAAAFAMTVSMNPHAERDTVTHEEPKPQQ